MFDMILIGLDHAPKSFNLHNKLLGPDGCNLEFIQNETGVAIVLKGLSCTNSQPLHFTFVHNDVQAINAAKNLARGLIDTVRLDLEDFFKNNPPEAIAQSVPIQYGTQNTVLTTNNVPTISTPRTIAHTAPPAHLSVQPPVLPTIQQNIPQTPNVVAVQQQPQILQVVPNHQIFIAQDGTQYVQVKVTPTPAPVTQFVAQNPIVLPQGVNVNGAMLSLSQVQTSVPVIMQPNIALSQSNIMQNVSSVTCSVAQTSVPPPPAPVPPPAAFIPSTILSPPPTSFHPPLTLPPTNIPPPTLATIPPSVQNIHWSTEKQYTVTQTQLQPDNVQWTAQVNSQTTLVQNQQLSFTSQVAPSNVQQILPPPQTTMPWHSSSEQHKVHTISRGQIKESQNLPLSTAPAGFESNINNISGVPTTWPETRKTSTEDNTERQVKAGENIELQKNTQHSIDWSENDYKGKASSSQKSKDDFVKRYKRWYKKRDAKRQLKPFDPSTEHLDGPNTVDRFHKKEQIINVWNTIPKVEQTLVNTNKGSEHRYELKQEFGSHNSQQNVFSQNVSMVPNVTSDQSKGRDSKEYYPWNKDSIYQDTRSKPVPWQMPNTSNMPSKAGHWR